MMKRIAISILSLGLFVGCQQEAEKHRTPVIQNPQPVVASNESKDDSESEFVDIVATQSGRLEWISPKTNVNKNAPLYRIKNANAFKNLYSTKTTFRRELDSLITTCPDELNPIRDKWERFYASFRLDSLTPIFPKLEFKEEADHFGMNKFVNDYNNIVIFERGMKKYFVQAPVAMQEIQWFKKSGERIEKGEVIGKFKMQND